MLEAATFGVRELAPAFAAESLLPARVGPPWAPARWLAESGTKVPHSKALRASNIFRAESRKMRRLSVGASLPISFCQWIAGVKRVQSPV